MPQYSFLPFLQPFPIGTRILTGLVLVGSLLQVLLVGLDARTRGTSDKLAGGTGLEVGAAGSPDAVVPYLVCVPGKALPWFFWTFLTAGFVEIKPFEVSTAGLPASMTIR